MYITKRSIKNQVFKKKNSSTEGIVKLGLQIKVKYLCFVDPQIIINGTRIENVKKEYGYPCLIIMLRKENKDFEIARKNRLKLAAFTRLAYIMKNERLPRDYDHKSISVYSVPLHMEFKLGD